MSFLCSRIPPRHDATFSYHLPSFSSCERFSGFPFLEDFWRFWWSLVRHTVGCPLIGIWYFSHEGFLMGFLTGITVLGEEGPQGTIFSRAYFPHEKIVNIYFFIFVKESKIKLTTNYHHTLIGMAVIQYHNNRKDSKHRKAHSLLVGMQDETATLEEKVSALTKTNVISPYDPAIMFLGIRLTELKMYVHTDSYPWTYLYQLYS